MNEPEQKTFNALVKDLEKIRRLKNWTTSEIEILEYDIVGLLGLYRMSKDEKVKFYIEDAIKSGEQHNLEMFAFKIQLQKLLK